MCFYTCLDWSKCERNLDWLVSMVSKYVLLKPTLASHFFAEKYKFQKLYASVGFFVCALAQSNSVVCLWVNFFLKSVSQLESESADTLPIF